MAGGWWARGTGSNETFREARSIMARVGWRTMACSCTILDVRREQILEASGRLWVRLVCNVCGVTIDSEQVSVGPSVHRAVHVPPSNDSLDARIAGHER
jgi:hypothetical protein